MAEEQKSGGGSKITVKMPKVNVPKVNPWLVSTIILLLLSIVLYVRPGILGGVGTTGAASAGGAGALTAEEAANKAVEWITAYYEAGGMNTGVELIEAKETENGIVEFTIKVSDQNGETTQTLYVTADGKFFLPQAIETEDKPETQPQEQPPVPESPKSDKPDVKLFVMSYCPYGNVAEEAMKPVADLLGDKIDLKVHYIVSISGDQISALHGKAEADENIREACIQRDYDMATFWEFLTYTNNKCSLSNIDTCWEDAADATGVDKEAVEACFDADGLSLMEADTDLARSYSASGSPTLIINGARVSPARTPESYKQTICNAFNEPPEECSETLAGGAEAPSSGGC